MLYNEYKTALEEILRLTEELEDICNSKRIDDIEKPFMERDAIFKKLSQPDSMSDEELNYILELKNKIQEKNNSLMRSFKVIKNEIKNELLSLKSESKVIDAYKIPKTDFKSSIYDSFE